LLILIDFFILSGIYAGLSLLMVILQAAGQPKIFPENSKEVVSVAPTYI